MVRITGTSRHALNGANNWYIATALNEDGLYKMDHLQRLNKISNLKWKHPNTPDIEDMLYESIVVCKIDG